MALLFDVDRTRILRHINNIYSENELDQKSTCAENAQVLREGKREVMRSIKLYNLYKSYLIKLPGFQCLDTMLHFVNLTLHQPDATF